MTDATDPVPAFSTDVASTDVAGAFARLDAFALEHGVAASARRRLARVTADVFEQLAGLGEGAGPTLLEADIDQGTLQVLFTRALGSADSVAQARRRLADTAESCDDFATYRVGGGSTLEVWVCFELSG